MMKDDQEYSDLLAKWLKEDLSEEEQLRLEQSGNLDDLKIVIEDIATWSLPEIDIEQKLSTLKREHLQKRETRVVSLRVWMSIAASFLLLIGFYFGSEWLTGDRTIETALGEQIDHELPDGSLVKIDALSSISYASDWDNERKLKLTGRAFFDVSKGHVFTVKTSLGEVQVLGTEFEVAAIEERFEVSCFEGRVQVLAGDQSEILTVGEAINLEEGVLVRFTFQNTQPHWLKGFSQFENAPLSDVLTELKKYYEIEIHLPDKYINHQFSGRFPHNDLKLALRSIFDPLEISFTLTTENEMIFD
ncbi:MAG: FecR domain-containing protein [Reichenbachiella sp.]|uniref:FecR family protein n=1 Tax=Reichenbachiella sp. TaxID=2184521 RepID=UPI003264F876